MDSQQAFGQNYLYHEPDIKKSLGMVIHALTCKSEALSKAEQNLLLANQEIHRLKQTLTQEQEARCRLEREQQVLDEAVRDHWAVLSEHFGSEACGSVLEDARGDLSSTRSEVMTGICTNRSVMIRRIGEMEAPHTTNEEPLGQITG